MHETQRLAHSVYQPLRLMHLFYYRANPLHVLGALPVVSDMQMDSLGCVRDHFIRRRGQLQFLQR